MMHRTLLNKASFAIGVTAVVAIAGGIATVSAAQPNASGSAQVSGYEKDQCKDGGWRNFKNPDGTPMFKNQGQCVAFFASSESAHTNTNNTNQNTDIRQSVTSGPADHGAASGNVAASSRVDVSATTNSSE